MRRALIGFLALVACSGDGNTENSPMCGFQSIAGANLVLEQLKGGTKTLDELPPDVGNVVPVRVVGHGTARAIAAQATDGLVLGYEGEGFPAQPGFGLVLVEDSLDTFKGVLVYELEPPTHLPRLGTIASAQSSIPLYGMRVTWGAVSSQRCPLFGTVDTTR